MSNFIYGGNDIPFTLFLLVLTFFSYISKYSLFCYSRCSIMFTSLSIIWASLMAGLPYFKFLLS